MSLALSPRVSESASLLPRTRRDAGRPGGAGRSVRGRRQWPSFNNKRSSLNKEAKPGQILISARVVTKVDHAVKVEPVGEFELKGIRRPLAAYNVVAAVSSNI